jgi:hypothetical protein
MRGVAVTANELIRLLREWPTELEVLIESPDGKWFLLPKSVSLEQGGASSWLEIKTD